MHLSPTHAARRRPFLTDAEPTVLADVDAAGMEDLLRLLKRYRLRQKLDIQDVSQQYRVWARWGGAAAEDGGAEVPPGWAPDPRLPQLGLRAVLPRGGEGEAAGGAAGWEAHRRWRMLHGVAEGDSEIPSGEGPTLCLWVLRVPSFPVFSVGRAVLLLRLLPLCVPPAIHRTVLLFRSGWSASVLLMPAPSLLQAR